MLVYKKSCSSGELSHKEKAAMFVHALITREIMRSKDAQ